MELHWQTISNRYALEINQDYAGFSGSRFAQSVEMETFSPWCELRLMDLCFVFGVAHPRKRCPISDWGPSPGRSDASCEWPRTWSWYKPLSGRDARRSTMAVLLMNNANSSSTVGFQWKQVPGLAAKTQCNVFDVWAGKSLGIVKGAGYTAKGLAPRDSAFLTLSACE